MSDASLSAEQVLVTGGCGFIGAHSVRALLKKGASVTVLDDLSSGTRSALHGLDGVRLVEGDIRDPALVGELVRQSTRVLHLAAQVSVSLSVEQPLASLATNIQGFVNVIHQASLADVSRFVYASSAAVYGAAETEVIPEWPRATLRPLSPYGVEKLTNDHYADLYSRTNGAMKVLGLRYFNVYGPGQSPKSSYSGVISRFVDAVSEERPVTVFGDGSQTRDFVSVHDVADCNAWALFSEATGVVNVGTGAKTSLNELIEIISSAAGKEISRREAAPREGDILHSVANIARLRELRPDYSPIRVERGLRELVEGLSEQKTRGFRE